MIGHGTLDPVFGWRGQPRRKLQLDVLPLALAR
jgi:hypothetical protein